MRFHEARNTPRLIYMFYYETNKKIRSVGSRSILLHNWILNRHPPEKPYINNVSTFDWRITSATDKPTAMAWNIACTANVALDKWLRPLQRNFTSNHVRWMRTDWQIEVEWEVDFGLMLSDYACLTSTQLGWFWGVGYVILAPWIERERVRHFKITKLVNISGMAVPLANMNGLLYIIKNTPSRCPGSIGFDLI